MRRSLGKQGLGVPEALQILHFAGVAFEAFQLSKHARSRTLHVLDVWQPREIQSKAGDPLDSKGLQQVWFSWSMEHVVLN